MCGWCSAPRPRSSRDRLVGVIRSRWRAGERDPGGGSGLANVGAGWNLVGRVQDRTEDSRCDESFEAADDLGLRLAFLDRSSNVRRVAGSWRMRTIPIRYSDRLAIRLPPRSNRNRTVSPDDAGCGQPRTASRTRHRSGAGRRCRRPRSTAALPSVGQRRVGRATPGTALR